MNKPIISIAIFLFLMGCAQKEPATTTETTPAATVISDSTSAKSGHAMSLSVLDPETQIQHRLV